MTYPSVSHVSCSLTRAEFEAQRLSAGGWAHNDALVRNVLEGRYDAILPLHVELCATYRCNFSCPWCSCALSRRTNGAAHDTLTAKELRAVLLRLAAHGIGVQWTGGEPLCNPALPEAAALASSLGMNQCLFTNGSLLGGETADALLRTNLRFIRISLNTADPDVHRRFHGLEHRALSEQTLRRFVEVCERKLRLGSRVRLGVSIVLDSTDVDAFPMTLDFLSRTARQAPGALNYAVIRAVNEDFSGISFEKRSDFSQKYEAALAGESFRALSGLDVELVLPNRGEPEFVPCTGCRGCSVFSELAPDGELFLCSAQYGNRDYAIGNLLEHTVEEIWGSERLRRTRRRAADCFASHRCPRYSRGWQFQTLFAEIEAHRARGELDLVRAWIESLRRHIPDEGHSFYI